MYQIKESQVHCFAYTMSAGGNSRDRRPGRWPWRQVMAKGFRMFVIVGDLNTIRDGLRALHQEFAPAGK